MHTIWSCVCLPRTDVGKPFFMASCSVLIEVLICANQVTLIARLRRRARRRKSQEEQQEVEPDTA